MKCHFLYWFYLSKGAPVLSTPTFLQILVLPLSPTPDGVCSCCSYRMTSIAGPFSWKLGNGSISICMSPVNSLFLPCVHSHYHPELAARDPSLAFEKQLGQKYKPTSEETLRHSPGIGRHGGHVILGFKPQELLSLGKTGTHVLIIITSASSAWCRSVKPLTIVIRKQAL